MINQPQNRLGNTPRGGFSASRVRTRFPQHGFSGYLVIFSINTCFNDRFPDFEADLLPPAGPSTQLQCFLLIRHRLFPHHIVRHRCFLLTLYCFPLVYGRRQPLFVGRDPHRSQRQSPRRRLADRGRPPAFLVFFHFLRSG